jgi:hypothetical protein
MMMAATTLAVATPHALVLTVSHDLLFRQPPDVRRRECRPSGLMTHKTSLQHDASFSTVSIPDSLIPDSLIHDSLIHDSLGDASAMQRHRANAALQTRSSSPLPQRGPLTFETSAMQPYPAVSPQYCEPLLVRDILNNERKTDGTSRSEFGDPVCRLSGFRYSGFRFTWPALQSL